MQKIDFYYMIKNNPNKTYKLLNITSPSEKSVKYVYHPIMEDIQVKNY
jgi:hypothetical protein